MTVQIDAGSYSTDSYNSWDIDLSSPLLPEAGGTGVSNPVGSTLTFSGDVSLSPAIALSTGLSVAAVSGCSSPSFTGLQVIKADGSAVGDFVDIVGTISLTSTATTAVFDITVPTATTAVFADAAQANGVSVVTSGTGLGNLVSVVTTASSRNIRVTMTLGTNAGTYTMNLALTYKIN